MFHSHPIWRIFLAIKMIHRYCSECKANFYPKFLWENWEWNRGRKVLIIAKNPSRKQIKDFQSQGLYSEAFIESYIDIEFLSKSLKNSLKNSFLAKIGTLS